MRDLVFHIEQLVKCECVCDYAIERVVCSSYQIRGLVRAKVGCIVATERVASERQTGADAVNAHALCFASIDRVTCNTDTACLIWTVVIHADVKTRKRITTDRGRTAWVHVNATCPSLSGACRGIRKQVVGDHNSGVATAGSRHYCTRSFMISCTLEHRIGDGCTGNPAWDIHAV